MAKYMQYRNMTIKHRDSGTFAVIRNNEVLNKGIKITSLRAAKQFADSHAKSAAPISETHKVSATEVLTETDVPMIATRRIATKV